MASENMYRSLNLNQEGGKMDFPTRPILLDTGCATQYKKAGELEPMQKIQPPESSAFGVWDGSGGQAVKVQSRQSNLGMKA